MTIETRQPVHPDHFRHMDSTTLSETFLIPRIFYPGEARFTYTLFDRIIVGGVEPVSAPIILESDPALATRYFLERRELGAINLGGPGTISVDGEEFRLAPRDGMYIGAGARNVAFSSDSAAEPARFYCASTRAHRACPTVAIPADHARRVHLGDAAEANERTIRQYVHPEVLESAELAMGLTTLVANNVWNTMPTHTHDRRSEVYLYLDLPEEAVVFHMIGTPEETRHLVVRNEQAVISPNWSIHTGVGTNSYSLIWAMAGENQEYTDMDPVAMKDLR